MWLQIDFGSIVPSKGRKKTKRLELCVEIYAKNEKKTPNFLKKCQKYPWS